MLGAGNVKMNAGGGRETLEKAIPHRGKNLTVAQGRQGNMNPSVLL